MPFPAGGYETAIGHCPAPCPLHPVPLASNGSQTLECIGTGESEFWINSLHGCLYRDPINYPLQPHGLSDHLGVPSSQLQLLLSAITAVAQSCQTSLQACVVLSSQGFKHLQLHSFGLAIPYCLNCVLLDQLFFLDIAEADGDV